MSAGVAVDQPGVTGEERPVGQGPAGEEQPVIRVVRGNPSAAQLAALTVVLSAASGSSDASHGPRQRTLWTAKSRYARPRPAVGPGGWRASALPR